jgi:hypothetical protein
MRVLLLQPALDEAGEDHQGRVGVVADDEEAKLLVSPDLLDAGGERVPELDPGSTAATIRCGA